MCVSQVFRAANLLKGWVLVTFISVKKFEKIWAGYKQVKLLPNVEQLGKVMQKFWSQYKKLLQQKNSFTDSSTLHFMSFCNPFMVRKRSPIMFCARSMWEICLLDE